MSLRQPPLADTHADRGASVTEFGGWEMPVEFDSIKAEHRAVREAAGIFDVSHMGELAVSGPDAGRLTDKLVTNDVLALDPGEACYAAITDAKGIMLDDTVVYNLPDAWGDADYLVIPNAGHDREMYDRWAEHREAWDLDATVENRTEDLAMFAVQGPEAPDLVLEHLDEADRETVEDLGRFEATVQNVGGAETLLARTGYTGEKGFELICDWDDADAVWSAFDCQPCGLGARDTLRLEMGFLLSGQDFDPEDEPRNPFEADLDFAVKLDREFVGRDALEGVDVEGVDEELTGLEMIDRGVPRAGYTVTTPDGEELGQVTSGTMSPTLERGIALAYLPVEDADSGETVRVEVRGEPKKARTTTPPFLDR